MSSSITQRACFLDGKNVFKIGLSDGWNDHVGQMLGYCTRELIFRLDFMLQARIIQRVLIQGVGVIHSGK